MIALECLDPAGSLENQRYPAGFITSLATDLLACLSLTDDPEARMDPRLFRAGEVAVELVAIGCELLLATSWRRPIGPTAPTKRPKIRPRDDRSDYPVDDPVGEARRLVRPRLSDAISAMQAGGSPASVEEQLRLRDISSRINPYGLRLPSEAGPRESRIREAFPQFRKIGLDRAVEAGSRDVSEWPALRDEWARTGFRLLPSTIGSGMADGDVADNWLAGIAALTAVAFGASQSLEEAFDSFLLGVGDPGK